MPWMECDRMSLREEFVLLATADSSNVAELCRRVRRFITEVKNLLTRQHAQTEQQKNIQLGFGRIRYHARLLRRNGDRQDGHDYRKIEDSIRELCEMGVVPLYRPET